MASKSNKVDAEGSESQLSELSKLVAVKSRWNGFVESSTLHGLQHVFTSRSPGRRIIWALFLLLGIGWFSFQSSQLVTKYYSYPVTTKVTQVYEDAPEFPAITICNFNMFRQSVVQASEYGQLFTYVLRRSMGIDVSNDTVDWSKYDSINMTEFTLAMGHQIEDTLSSCTWSGEKCTAENFTAVLTSMGLCYTFNSGKIFRRNKRSLSTMAFYSVYYIACRINSKYISFGVFCFFFLSLFSFQLSNLISLWYLPMQQFIDLRNSLFLNSQFK